MKYLIMILISFLGLNSFAGSWLEVADLSIDAKMFTGRADDGISRAINRSLDKELNLGMNIDMMGFGYFNNKVIGRTSCVQGQQCAFTSVAYDFQVGARVMPWLDLEYGHRSSHALDHAFPYFVEDYVGFRINLIKADKKVTILP